MEATSTSSQTPVAKQCVNPVLRTFTRQMRLSRQRLLPLPPLPSLPCCMKPVMLGRLPPPHTQHASKPSTPHALWRQGQCIQSMSRPWERWPQCFPAERRIRATGQADFAMCGQHARRPEGVQRDHATSSDRAGQEEKNGACHGNNMARSSSVPTICTMEVVSRSSPGPGVPCTPAVLQ